MTAPTPTALVTIQKLQDQIMSVECVRIFARTRSKRLVKPYSYTEPAGDLETLGNVMSERIRKHFPRGCRLTVSLGNGQLNPHERTTMEVVRKSYD